jgi:PTH2 family peptidyl-tRNA hydrolase
MHETLTAMGFASLLSLNSLRQTGATNIDAAMEWIETNQDRAGASSSLLPVARGVDAASVMSALASLNTRELEHKMMLVVRDDLGMSSGKVRRYGQLRIHRASSRCPHLRVGALTCVPPALSHAEPQVGAQCAHAAVSLFQLCQLSDAHAGRLAAWTRAGQKKVVVSASSLSELNRLAQAAGAARLPYYVVCDAGRTEVAAGSSTVLAIGPALDGEVNPITGELRLL